MDKIKGYYKLIDSYFKRYQSSLVEAGLHNALVTLIVKGILIIIHYSWLISNDKIADYVNFFIVPLGVGSFRPLFSNLILVSLLAALLQYFFFHRFRLFFWYLLNWFFSRLILLEGNLDRFKSLYIRGRNDLSYKVTPGPALLNTVESAYFIYKVVLATVLQYYLLAVVIAFFNLMTTLLVMQYEPTGTVADNINRFRSGLKLGELKLVVKEFFFTKGETVDRLFQNDDLVTLLQPWLMFIASLKDNVDKSTIFYAVLERTFVKIVEGGALKLKDLSLDSELREPFPLEDLPPALQAGLPTASKKVVNTAIGAVGTAAAGGTIVAVKHHFDKELQKEIRVTNEHHEFLKQQTQEHLSNLRKQEGVYITSLLNQQFDKQRDHLGQQLDRVLDKINNDKDLSYSNRVELKVEAYKEYNKSAFSPPGPQMWNRPDFGPSKGDPTNGSLPSPLENNDIFWRIVSLLRKLIDNVLEILRPVWRFIMSLFGF